MLRCGAARMHRPCISWAAWQPATCGGAPPTFLLPGAQRHRRRRLQRHCKPWGPRRHAQRVDVFAENQGRLEPRRCAQLAGHSMLSTCMAPAAARQREEFSKTGQQEREQQENGQLTNNGIRESMDRRGPGSRKQRGRGGTPSQTRSSMGCPPSARWRPCTTHHGHFRGHLKAP